MPSSEGQREKAGNQRWSIRAARLEDLPQLHEIVRASPEAASWVPDPAPGEARWSRGTVVIVAADERNVIGFVAARLVADDAEILNIGVRPGRRKEGAGAALLEQAEWHLQDQGARRIFMEVRESNQAAIALYKKRNFCRGGLRRGYYRNPDENAVVLQKDLSRSPIRTD